MERKEIIIAVGVTVGAAVLVLFMKGHNAGNATAGSGTGGVTDIMGGFTSASTVYIPTSSYDLNFNTYKGSVSYSTVTNNSQSETTTTYAPVNSNNGSPVNSPTVGNGSSVSGLVSVPPPASTSGPPVITTGSNNVVNIPTQQTNTTPAAPVAAAPPPPPPNRMMGNMHYATPSGGWDPNSVVDYIKSKGGYADFASRKILYDQTMGGGYTGSASQNVMFLHALEAYYGNQGGFN